MSAGTITLTNNGTAVTGAGTDFVTDLKASDFIVATVGGTVYSLAVETVTGATAAVLSLPFEGPTVANVAWYAVPRKTMLRVTAELNNQVTKALRLSNENALNWQALLSADDQATVILPDGTTLTGYSWKKISDILGTIDIDHLDTVAAQVEANATQVAADTQTVTTKAAEVASAATQVAADKVDVDAKAAQVTLDASTSAANAAKAKTEADRAEAAAGNVDFTMTDVRNLIDAISPIGQKIEWPSLTLPDNVTLGVKYLRLNGGTFDTALYPKLAAIYSSGVLPDMRGEVARGFDDGRGVDQGRAILSEQLDAAPNATGIIGGMSNDGSTAGYTTGPTGVFTTLGAAAKALAPGISLGAGTRYTALTFDLSAGGVNAAYGRDGATEVRMRNIAWNMIVRAS